MKKILFLLLVTCCLTACYDNLEERAQKECIEYTEKKCPTPITNNTRVDSMVYESQTRTIHYYHSLFNEADNAAAIRQNQAELRKKLLDGVRNEIALEKYKEAGFNFRYTFHSGKNPSKILFDVTYKKGEY
ncbi:MAG: hypothetical protein SOZ07_02990 [Prevotella sp.]|nr:hypothetical protein [Prevotellaceae bacterium]MDY3935612.1 hypothetical protein [Prevotella sp.]